MKNKISILMTVHNFEKYIKKSIESILSQSFGDFELIIVDDLSTDNTVKIINSINDERINLFKLQKKIGRTKALNFGLNKINSDLIAIQDADDISEPDRIEKTINCFNDSTVGLVCSRSKFIDNNDNEISNKFQKIKKFNSKKLKIENFIAHSSTTFRSKINGHSFFYDESFIYAQDYKMILTFLLKSKIHFLDEYLVKIRVHEKNMSNDEKIEKLRILEKIKLLNFVNNNFKNTFLESQLIKVEKLKLIMKLNLLKSKKFFK